MKALLFLLLSLITSFSAFSQEPVLLKGKIIADSIMESSVHIVNLTQKTGAVNSETGNFQIKVQENDTLFFSSIQFEGEELIITPQIIQNPVIEVSLNSILLEEVRISDINLSGNLERDLKSIEVFDQSDFGFDLQDKPVRSMNDRNLAAARSSAVGLLYSAITGELKMMKKMQEWERFHAFVEKAKNKLPDEVYVKEFQLEREDIINFVFYCAENDPGLPTLVATYDELQLLEYYRKMLPGYRKMREGEAGK